MKKARFTEEQIIGILREHEAGSATADVCRKHGISSATFYKWKEKYGGLEVSEARRLRSLEDENRRLKKLLAETMLDNAMLKDIASKNGDARRSAGGRGTPRQGTLGEPAAGVPRDRGGPGPGPLPKPSTGRQGCPQALARAGGVRRRIGWRRLRVLLSREGVHMNH
jgi:putative transposase